MSKPLEGMKVLDFTMSVSGAVCSLFLSDFGAEVLKIEMPECSSRTVSEKEKCARATLQRGKRSLFLDMKKENNRNIFRELCEGTDIVLEDFKPGMMETWGITYEEMKKINPSIVYTSVTGYGQKGPYAGRGASDASIQAESGLMSITGKRDGTPVKCGAEISSYLTAMTACIGTLTAAVGAKRTGCGRRVDVSMLDSTVMCLENQLAVYLKDKKIPGPMGNSYDLFAPVGLYHTKDKKEFMLSVGTDGQWKALCQALKRPEWVENPQYVTNMRRVEHNRILDQLLQEEFSKYDREELSGMLQSGHCVYGNINDFHGVEEHPQIKERGMIVDAVYPDGTRYRVPGNPIWMSGMEREKEYPVYLPENTEEHI